MNIEAAMTLPGQQTRSTGASTPFPRQQPRLGPLRFSPGTGQPGSEAAPIHPRDRRHHAITAKSAMPAVAAVLAVPAACLAGMTCRKHVPGCTGEPRIRRGPLAGVGPRWRHHP